MGKAAKASKVEAQKQRHDGPLHVQLLRDNGGDDSALVGSAATVAGPKKKAAGGGGGGRAPARRLLHQNQQHQQEENDSDDDAVAPAFVDPKTSRKILNLARAQQKEDGVVSDTRGRAVFTLKPASGDAHVASSAGISDAVDDGDEQDDFEVDEAEEDWDADAEYENQLGIDQSDAALIEKFMNSEPKKQINLADAIMAKIQEAEERQDDDMSGTKDTDDARMHPSRREAAARRLDPRVVSVYKKVGILLSRYRSGKLPKAFKLIPSLPNWPEILDMTNPSSWTPNATYEATRLFISNLSAKVAFRFCRDFLLDRIRDDIAETKKLNYHHYMALKKSVYKPSAFFKGILFPLCESGNCSLREAAIIGSIMTKVSIPVLDSAAALLKIAEMDYTGPNSLFIRVLLDKKYALPYKVVDALVFHFVRFKTDKRWSTLPVLWHQSLLAFAQRYKSELVPEQKEALMDLIRAQFHHAISPEIRRELQNSKCRGELIDIDMLPAV
ncbi:hypothetical protein HK405_012874 [Cladochytrium tenue]|nr:hypothetical protein HK405_012874 [Cladochytrium tenue]